MKRFNCSKSLKIGQNKVIKEKWGQYFANDHFCTPLCSKRNGNSVIKIFLEQKFAKSSVVNLVSDTWFNEKNAIKKGVQNWYFGIVCTMLYGYDTTYFLIRKYVLWCLFMGETRGGKSTMQLFAWQIKIILCWSYSLKD